jgi:hypothetical protein
MEQFYKGHRIEVSVWLDGDGWFASLFIFYSKGTQNILETFAMHDTFKTYDGAIEAGFAAAQKWIDGGSCGHSRTCGSSLNPGPGGIWTTSDSVIRAWEGLGLMFVRPNDEDKHSDRENEKNESG